MIIPTVSEEKLSFVEESFLLFNLLEKKDIYSV